MHCLSTKFRVGLRLASSECLRVLGIGYLVFAHACNLTSVADPKAVPRIASAEILPDGVVASAEMLPLAWRVSRPNPLDE
jgi:hypothetical protein